MWEDFRQYFRNLKPKERTYLDFAAATPVRRSILKKMHPFFREHWANPSAIYAEGVAQRKIIDTARERLARTLSVRASGIIFTSGGTESNNLALIGFVRRLYDQGRAYKDIEIITTRVEHPSILETCEHLGSLGVRITYAPIDAEGLIKIEAFKKLVSKRTALVSVAYVNSETGVIQDIRKLTRIIRKWNQEHGTAICVHTDACQAPLWLPCALNTLGVDMLSLDAGKCYGPKGTGVLALKRNAEIGPTLFGGGQERGLRAGTENPALIVGCVESILMAQQDWKVRSDRVQKIRNHGFSLVDTRLPGAVVNGSREKRVANNINISIQDVDTEFAVIVLDAHGIAASTRSACGSLKDSGSYVVREMTKNDVRANTTLRFTLGEESTESDLDRACSIVATHIARMKNAQEEQS